MEGKEQGNDKKTAKGTSGGFGSNEIHERCCGCIHDPDKRVYNIDVLRRVMAGYVLHVVTDPKHTHRTENPWARASKRMALHHGHHHRMHGGERGQTEALMHRGQEHLRPRDRATRRAADAQGC